MSVDVMGLIWARAPYSGGSLNLLLSLGDWANEDGDVVYTKHQEATILRLALKTRQGKRQVIRQIGKFTRDEIITVIRQVGGPNRYKINVEKLRCFPLIVATEERKKRRKAGRITSDILSPVPESGSGDILTPPNSGDGVTFVHEGVTLEAHSGDILSMQRDASAPSSDSCEPLRLTCKARRQNCKKVGRSAGRNSARGEKHPVIDEAAIAAVDFELNARLHCGEGAENTPNFVEPSAAKGLIAKCWEQDRSLERERLIGLICKYVREVRIPDHVKNWLGWVMSQVPKNFERATRQGRDLAESVRVGMAGD